MIVHNERRLLLFCLGLGFSFVLHFALIAYLIYQSAETPGTTSEITSAISINLENTEVLEAYEESAEKSASASASSPPGDARFQTQEQPRPEKPIEPEQKVEEVKPIVEEAPVKQAEAAPEIPQDHLSQQQDQQTLAKQEPKEPENTQPNPDNNPIYVTEPAKTVDAPKPEPLTPKPPEPLKKRTPPKPRQAQAGGANASGSNANTGSQGRISARTGNKRNYSAIVFARIASRKPRGRKSGGSVLISLSIDPSGLLSEASIERSSGDKALDQSALSAVKRAAPFPPPPGGSARFTVPFQFR